MRNSRPSFRKQFGKPLAAGLAVALVLVATGAPARAEKTSAAPARKTSYAEVRRGLFAMSKFGTAPIVMLGDSLMEAGPWDELTGCREIANRGIGGDTTARVLDRLDAVLKLKPRAVFLMIGVNDISLRVPAETTAKNLTAILDGLNGANVQTFMHYVLPVAASYGKKRMKEDIAALNTTIASLVVGRANTTMIDLRPRVAGADGYLHEELAWDGQHLSARGYEIWRDAIAPQVAKYCVP